jgi:hypothetical protein
LQAAGCSICFFDKKSLVNRVTFCVYYYVLITRYLHYKLFDWVLRKQCFGGGIGCANRVNQSSPPKKTDSASSGAGACFLIIVLTILVCSKLNVIYSIANRRAASGRVLRRGRRFRSRGRCRVVVYRCFVWHCQ